MTAAERIDESSAFPEILCGAHHDDGWVSPYVRGRFPGPSGPVRLVLSLYCPGTEPGAPRVAVRRGAAEILFEDVVPPGELVTWRREIPPQTGAAQPLDISIRCERPCAAADGDVRQLGIIVTEWRLEAAAPERDDTLGLAIPDRPASADSPD